MLVIFSILCISHKINNIYDSHPHQGRFRGTAGQGGLLYFLLISTARAPCFGAAAFIISELFGFGEIMGKLF
jgi:hypothetical protein